MCCKLQVFVYCQQKLRDWFVTFFSQSCYCSKLFLLLVATGAASKCIKKYYVSDDRSSNDDDVECDLLAGWQLENNTHSTTSQLISGLRWYWWGTSLHQVTHEYALTVLLVFTVRCFCFFFLDGLTRCTFTRCTEP